MEGSAKAKGKGQGEKGKVQGANGKGVKSFGVKRKVCRVKCKA